MNAPKDGMSCQTGCWALAFGVGFITFLLLLTVGDNGWLGSIFLGGVAFVILGFVFSFIFCKPLTRPVEAAAALKTPGSAGVKPGSAGKTPGSAGTSGAGGGGAGASATSATGSASTKGSPATTGNDLPGSAPIAADAEAGAKVKPSKELAGQKELSERKGNWKYGEDASSDASASGSASKSNPEADAVAPAMAAGAASGADKDAATAASLEPDAPQEKPATLDAPRDGGKDNLKEIKGVGPKLETMLNEMGFYHFDQIAGWSESEVNWVNQNLTGFRGRVTRDEWVAQAKTLAAGGETEFSQRVGKGDVY